MQVYSRDQTGHRAGTAASEQVFLFVHGAAFLLAVVNRGLQHVHSDDDQLAAARRDESRPAASN
jgi:hypothetical protein